MNKVKISIPLPGYLWTLTQAFQSMDKPKSEQELLPHWALTNGNRSCLINIPLFHPWSE